MEKINRINQIKQTGPATNFETGAYRDNRKGKGRFDVMTMETMASLIKLANGEQEVDKVLTAFDKFQKSGNIFTLHTAFVEVAKIHNRNIWEVMLDLAFHFEDGEEKYPANDPSGKLYLNAMKGFPATILFDSAVRHYVKFRAGHQDEPHLRATLWNLYLMIWTCEHKPELDNFLHEKYQAKAVS